MSNVYGVSSSPWAQWSSDLALGYQVTAPLEQLYVLMNQPGVTAEQVQTLYNQVYAQYAAMRNNPDPRFARIEGPAFDDWTFSVVHMFDTWALGKNFQMTPTLPVDSSGNPIPSSTTPTVTLNGVPITFENLPNNDPSQQVQISYSFSGNLIKKDASGQFYFAGTGPNVPGNTPGGYNYMMGSLMASAMEDGSASFSLKDASGQVYWSGTLTYNASTNTCTLTESLPVSQASLQFGPAPGVTDPFGPISWLL